MPLPDPWGRPQTVCAVDTDDIRTKASLTLCGQHLYSVNWDYMLTCRVNCPACLARLADRDIRELARGVAR